MTEIFAALEMEETVSAVVISDRNVRLLPVTEDGSLEAMEQSDQASTLFELEPSITPVGVALTRGGVGIIGSAVVEELERIHHEPELLVHEDDEPGGLSEDDFQNQIKIVDVPVVVDDNGATRFDRRGVLGALSLIDDQEVRLMFCPSGEEGDHLSRIIIERGDETVTLATGAELNGTGRILSAGGQLLGVAVGTTAGVEVWRHDEDGGWWRLPPLEETSPASVTLSGDGAVVAWQGGPDGLGVVRFEDERWNLAWPGYPLATSALAIEGSTGWLIETETGEVHQLVASDAALNGQIND